VDDPFYDDIQIMRNLTPPSGYKVIPGDEVRVLVAVADVDPFIKNRSAIGVAWGEVSHPAFFRTDINGPDDLSAYTGYQFTFGPQKVE